MKPMAIGIMPQEKIRERVLAIANGEYKPKSGEPRYTGTAEVAGAQQFDDDDALCTSCTRAFAGGENLDSLGSVDT